MFRTIAATALSLLVMTAPAHAGMFFLNKETNTIGYMDYVSDTDVKVTAEKEIGSKVILECVYKGVSYLEANNYKPQTREEGLEVVQTITKTCIDYVNNKLNPAY